MKDFPIVRSLRSATAVVLLIALPLLLLAQSPLTSVYLVMAVLYLLPTALCLSGLVGGFAPMMAGAAAGLYALYRGIGSLGLTLGAVYVLPIVAAFVVVIVRRIPFFQGCAVMMGVHVAALAAVYLLLQQRFGTDLYVVAGDAVSKALSEWELGDIMLAQLCRMGLIALPKEMAENGILQAVDGYSLSVAARNDLLLSVRSLVQAALASLVPATIASQSVLGGVACLLLPLRFGFIAQERRDFKADPAGESEEKQPVNFPDLGMPPLSQWFIPRGMGWKVGVGLMGGYLLQSSFAPVPAIAGVILYSVASAVFAIQGAALINFMQKTKGVRRWWRVALPVVLELLGALSMIGIFDQVINIRRLRNQPEPKEEK